MSMTPRERWQALLSGDSPDRIPCDYWATDEVTARLLQELGCANERELYARLGVDKCIRLSPVHRRTGEHSWHIQSQYRAWHIGTKIVSYGEGLGSYEETIQCPLAGATTVAEIASFDWPDPDDWDLDSLRAQCEEWRDFPIIAGCYEPFYLYCRLRGMEQALEDLVAEPQIAEAILECIHEIHEPLIRRMLERVGDRVDLTYVAEDLGTQDSLLMSPAVFRRFLKPRLARMIDMIHSFGIKVFHHDDGAIRPLIPDLIEIGIDILNPIQWRCRGMGRRELTRDFGRSLIFHGGVDNQRTLPFGTAEEVRREVEKNIETFRKCRGYIVAPCHNIQANTPTENIMALYDAVHEFGSNG
jgi:uroporphyrinogen decarboxylase